MKNIVIVFFLPLFFSAQIPLNERLVKTCQVWGFLKYFHDGPTNCMNWDAVLITKLPAVKSATNITDFNNVIQSLISAAGQMPAPTSSAPVVPAGYNTNLNTSWFSDPVFTSTITAQLDTVMKRFRPHSICDVLQLGGGIHFRDDSVRVTPNVPYPNNEQRLLMAFRYWNYIEYFFNSKNLMTTRWDSTLLKVIPMIDTASNATSFHLAFLQLISGINDTHASSSISAHLLNNHFGTFFPGIFCDYIENKAVVTYVMSGNSSAVKVGDIVTKINNIPVDTLYEWRKPFIPASNKTSLYRDLLKGNKSIFSGQQNSTLTLELQNATGSFTASLTRNVTRKMLQDSSKYGGFPFATIAHANCDIGYVNMGKLVYNDLQPMYNTLKTKSAIIFDMRNYPNATAWQLGKMLATSFYTYAVFHTPSLTFPGIRTNSFPQIISPDLQHPYQGNIYLLVNEQTQSQAEFSTMILQGLGSKVKVIGSQTAGADGDVTTIFLPSGITTYFSTLQVRYPDNTIAQRVGVKINYTVTPTISGIRGGYDELMNFAMQQAGCSVNVGLPRLNHNTDVLIYPNPVQEKLNLQFENAGIRNISVFSATGYHLLSHRCETDGETIQLSDLAAGLYMIEIKSTEHTCTYKFVKE